MGRVWKGYQNETRLVITVCTICFVYLIGKKPKTVFSLFQILGKVKMGLKKRKMDGHQKVLTRLDDPNHAVQEVK